VRSRGGWCPRVAVGFRVLIAAAAVPYLGLIGYNLSRMWDKWPSALSAVTWRADGHRKRHDQCGGGLLEQSLHGNALAVSLPRMHRAAGRSGHQAVRHRALSFPFALVQCQRPGGRHGNIRPKPGRQRPIPAMEKHGWCPSIAWMNMNKR
jgi:hypothetical protein